MEQELGTTGKGGVALPGTTWRSFAIAILAAVVLSVMATLLLGGSWSTYAMRPSAAGSPGGCGSGGSCCPPADK